MDGAKEVAARLEGEVEHHVAEKNDIEGFSERKGGAQIRMAEMAARGNFGFDDPVVADVVEVANEHPRGKPSIHLDAMIAPFLSALNDLSSDVGALDLNVPTRQ